MTRLVLLVLAALIAAPVTAAAQSWRAYSYPEAGFGVHFPAEPTVSNGAYRTSAGVSVPAVTYAASVDNIAYAVTIADLSKTDMAEEAAINDAVKTLGQAGKITVDVEERVNRHYGRQLSLERKDGSRSTLAVFFISGKLYVLDGKALPPDPVARSNRTSRFQQSLSFINP